MNNNNNSNNNNNKKYGAYKKKYAKRTLNGASEEDWLENDDGSCMLNFIPAIL